MQRDEEMELVAPSTDSDFEGYADVHATSFADKMTTRSDALQAIRKVARLHPEKLRHCRVIRLQRGEGREAVVVGTVQLQLEGDVGDVTFPPCLRHVCQPGEAYIETIATHSDYRGRGIGSKLLRWVDTYAQEKNCTKVSLHVMKKNAGAVRLYERKGFVIDETYDGPLIRCVIGLGCCLISCGKYFAFHYMVKNLTQ
jgi:ribosomal protein S18 acetylase RimI-like enzyme